jgi:hypothetical protein
MRSSLDDGVKLDGREINEVLLRSIDAADKLDLLAPFLRLGTRSSLRLFTPTS